MAVAVQHLSSGMFSKPVKTTPTHRLPVTPCRDFTTISGFGTCDRACVWHWWVGRGVDGCLCVCLVFLCSLCVCIHVYYVGVCVSVCSLPMSCVCVIFAGYFTHEWTGRFFGDLTQSQLVTPVSRCGLQQNHMTHRFSPSCPEHCRAFKLVW